MVEATEGVGLCGPRYGLRDLTESGVSTFLSMDTGFGLGAGACFGLGTGVLDLTESGV